MKEEEELRPHFLYNYSADKLGNIYNSRKRKMVIDARSKTVGVQTQGRIIRISQKLFVWECFNDGNLPADHEVAFDEYAEGDFIDKLIAVNKAEKKAFRLRQMDYLRGQLRAVGYKQHPTFQNYVVNKKGCVYSLYTQKILKAKPNVKGYIPLTLFDDDGKRVIRYKHVIVWEAITGTLVPVGNEIDHIDQDKSNNAFSNLNCLTRKNHALKTHNENPHIAKLRSKNLRRRVIRIKIGIDDEGSRKEFASRVAAAASVNFGKANYVSAAIIYNRPYSGFMWYDLEDPNPDFDNEYWVSLRCEALRKYCVSNIGRIWSPRGHKTFGCKTPLGYSHQYKGTNYGVHELVCLAFKGDKQTKSQTVDHIDRDPYNNRCENLRWATKQEQATNRKFVRPVEGYIKETGLIVGTWPTMTAAAKETGASIGSICTVLKGKGLSAGKTQMGQKIYWRFCDRTE